MKLSLNAFGGMMPGIVDNLRPPEAAETVTDCNLVDGSIVQVPNDLSVATPAKVGTKVSIYKYGFAITNDTQYWWHWLNDTDATRGPVAIDASERTYYTEAGQVPKVSDSSIALGGTAYPFASYTLGFPIPATVTGAASGSPTPGALPVTATVVCAFVSGWGEEGPPSVASANVAISDGQTLTVSSLPGAPAGAYNVATLRIYVSVFDVNGAGNFKFWKSVAIGASSTAGSFVAANLAEAVPSPYLLQPPADLFGLMLHPGKFLVGFTGRKLCRSEINAGHGWPAEYQDPLPEEIVGGAIMGSSTIICTKRGTYIAEGSTPDNQVPRRIEGLRYPCVAKRSIVNTDMGVAYASAHGLVMVTPDGQGTLLTEKLITPEAWAAYVPSSFTSVFWNGVYIAFFNTGGRTGGLMLDLHRKIISETSVYATAAWSEPRLNGALYLQVGADVVRWRAGGGTRSAIWRSPKRQLPRRRALGAARVIAETYPVTLKVWRDGVLTDTKVVASRKAVGLALVDGSTLQFECSGGSGIKGVEIATDKPELGAS